jgi:hypothetical protein
MQRQRERHRHTDSVGRPERKRPLGKFRSRWKDIHWGLLNTKMHYGVQQWTRLSWLKVGARGGLLRTP